MKISKKLKVVTIVGTRPEIIRLSAIINRLNNSDYIDHYLIHTGQNYDMNLNTVFFKDLNIKRKIFIHINTTNPALLENSPERKTANDSGWEIAFDSMEIKI